jgi:VWFA-related protein
MGKSKKFLFLLAFLSISFLLFPQEITHDVKVVNIEVPVRVFKGDEFVDDLTLKDFEVYEDGVLQKVSAVYLIKKKSVERKEEKREFSPETSRNFVLLFRITEYLPKVGESIDFFFQNVILPGDSLTVMTPMKVYNLNSRALKLLPKEKVMEELKEKLRKDTLVGNSEYLSTLRDLKSSSLGNLGYYRMLMQKLEELRYLDEEKLLNFADFLKKTEGQKNVFLFYQKEVLPQLAPETYHKLISLEQDNMSYLMDLQELFDFYTRDLTFDVDKVKQAFSDSSISIHFLYITKTPSIRDGMGSQSAVTWKEQSEDVFGAFREMAHATGGTAHSSANPAYSFQEAVEASENYYLVYYSPENYTSDGEFKAIKVKVKGKNYKVTHRAGYFAN